jgi:uncharacterized protein (TIGR03382 family)
MKSKAVCFAVVLLGLAVMSGDADAHIKLMKPASRPGRDMLGDPQKYAPCGKAGETRSTVVTVFKPGEEIEVVWTETVLHDGHFRISLDMDGQNDFKDPTGYDDIQTNPVMPVLADGVFKHTTRQTQPYRYKVRLPMTECTRCTLQLLQFMTDKPPFGPGGGNEFYYACADIEIRAGGGNPDGGASDAGMSAAGGRGGGGAGSGGSMGVGGQASRGGQGGTSNNQAGASGAGGHNGGGSDDGGGDGGHGGDDHGHDEGGGGCATAGAARGATGSGPLLLALGYLVMRRRRRPLRPSLAGSGNSRGPSA